VDSKSIKTAGPTVTIPLLVQELVPRTPTDVPTVHVDNMLETGRLSDFYWKNVQNSEIAVMDRWLACTQTPVRNTEPIRQSISLQACSVSEPGLKELTQ